MKFGIQTYGVSDWINQDAAFAFEKIAKSGFRMLEPCLWLSAQERPDNGFWSLEECRDRIAAAKEKGFSLCSVHVFMDSAAAQKQELKTLFDEYGIRNFVVKLQEPFNRANLEAQASALIEAADYVAAFEGKILLHNEKRDISSIIDGMSVYEWMLTHTEDKLFAEADIGWLLAGGEVPERFLWRNKERILAVHFKDVIASQGEPWEVLLGNGEVNLNACFQFVRAMEIPGILDMDKPTEQEIAEAGTTLQTLTSCRDHSRSILKLYDVEQNTITTIAEYDKVIEAPNWLKDGDTLLYNADGYIWKHSISKGTDERIDSGLCDNCNNDHVLSSDHTKVAVSHARRGTWESQIFIVPLEGGEPQLVVKERPSFLHGWSPDGKELAYCAFRPGESGKTDIDIYVCPIEEGQEKALTHQQGMNDGPEYQPDGKKIWFISDRSGLMQVYRMNTDGTQQEQMTFERQNNWFAHVSPDGKQVVNIAYSEKGLDSTEHLPNMQVSLWLMNSDGSSRKKLLDLFGGQGSINVNSWSPDSKKFAFVEYELEDM